MATKLKTFRKVLGSASAEQLTTTRILTQGFAVRSELTNDILYVGDSTVTASTGMFLQAGESNEKYARALARGYSTTYDLSKVYIIGTSGNAVRVEFEADE
jgi:hypothetical protein